MTKLGQPQAYADVGRGRILLQWFDYSPPHPIQLAIAFRFDDHRMIAVQTGYYAMTERVRGVDSTFRHHSSNVALFPAANSHHLRL
jgi:hypothetical protein